MIKLSLSKLLTLLIAGFSLILSPMVHGGSGASNAFDATSSTDFANTVEGSQDHTSNNKIHIFCDSGGADSTDPNQKCVIRLHALIGIKGEISSSFYSKAQITEIDIGTPTSSGGKQVTGSAGSFSSLTNDTVATTTPDNYVDTTGTSSMAASALGVTSGSATLASGDSASELGAAMTADHTVCFRGDSTADLMYDGGTSALATSSDTVATITGGSEDDEAVFELTAYNSTEIPRNTIGYADGFAVGYTVTVTSNTPTASASDCDGGTG